MQPTDSSRVAQPRVAYGVRWDGRGRSVVLAAGLLVSLLCALLFVSGASARDRGVSVVVMGNGSERSIETAGGTVTRRVRLIGGVVARIPARSVRAVRRAQGVRSVVIDRPFATRTEEEAAPARAIGVRIAIDDFGTGYSSMHALQRLPIDILKMARSFVEEDGLAFQATILQLASALGVQVVAEGIEHESQLARLRELGCAMGQGFYLCPPLSAVALLDWTAEELAAPGEPLGDRVLWGDGERDLTVA